MSIETHITIHAETQVWCDNQAEMQMLNTSTGTKRRKFIDIRHMYIYDIVEKCNMVIAHVKTTHQKEDIFTKPFKRVQFNRKRAVVGVKKLDSLETGACEAQKRLPGDEGPE